MDEATIRTLIAVCGLIMAVLAIPKGVIDAITSVKRALGTRHFKNA